MTPTVLTPRARALRSAHLIYAAAGIGAIASVWTAAITKRSNKFLAASLGLVALEAAALVVGGGDCPLNPVQERMGDPVPIFELFLPPGPARNAIPVLAAVTSAGLTTLVLNRPLSPRRR